MAMFIIQCDRRYKVDADTYYAVRSCGIKCPFCGRWNDHAKGSGHVEGKFNPKVKCSSKCRNARRFDCECECGGENHGVDSTVLT